MGRRILLVSFNGHPPRGAPSEPGFRSMTMGQASFVRESISLALDDIDWGDPSRGQLDAGGYHAELRLPADGPVDSVLFTTEGEGDAVPDLARLCGVNGWAAFDLDAQAYVDLEPKRPGGAGSPLAS